ncbi:MAG: tetratricopeptide repeat protein [Woeseiaceae bacterium]|nr:tetratricopeptide repeat protein [Woeseiaceae bacterium]
MTGKRELSILVIGVVALIGCAEKQDQASALPAADSTRVAFDAEGNSLGTVRFPTSCTEDAQPLLESGLALLHHMNYLKAEDAFLQASEVDPECAIAYWGAAMTHVHPLWPDTIHPDAQVSGQALLDKAAVASHTSEREQGYINALQAYYRESNKSETERLRAFASGWATVHEQHPDDLEASLFYALASLSTASMSDKSLAKQKAAGAVAERVKAEIPRHPGAHHYIIHAYDNPPLAENALETARSYDDVAPENTHALHMTSHIFTRRGLWPESITFNRRAANAAMERTPGGEVSLHYLHALDYLAYAYLQQANDRQASRVLDELNALEGPFQDHAATAYAFAAIPVRLALDRHDWALAAQASPATPDSINWTQYPYLVAIPEFARALGAAKTGDFDTARAAISELGVLEEQAAALNIAYDWGIQVAIQKTGAEAWLAYQQGDKDKALELMKRAAEMEASTDKNPVTPGEVLPASELYGDMLLETGDFAAALAAYETALQRSPNRFYSLYGAARAAELNDDPVTAAKYYQQLLDNCPEPSGDRAQLDHARGFLG